VRIFFNSPRDTTRLGGEAEELPPGADQIAALEMQMSKPM